MGKEYRSDELIYRIFYVSMAGIASFIAVVFLFIL